MELYSFVSLLAGMGVAEAYCVVNYVVMPTLNYSPKYWGFQKGMLMVRTSIAIWDSKSDSLRIDIRFILSAGRLA